MSRAVGVIMRELTVAEQAIVDFSDKQRDTTWATIEKSKEKRIKFFNLCKTAGLDTPEYQSDMDKDFFDSSKEALLLMSDTILETIIEEEAAQQAEQEAAASIFNHFESTQDVEEGEEIMENTTMSEKAKNFAEAAQTKVEEAAKYIVNYVPGVKETVKDVDSMKTDELEFWLKHKANHFYEDIKDRLEESKAKMDKMKGAPGVDRSAKEIDNILTTFNEILDDENKNGWGKVKAIVSALIHWIVRIIIKAAQIALKIAIVLVVGAIKIGAVAIDTTITGVGVVHKEIVSPAFDSAKEAYAIHKVNKAVREAAKEAAKEKREELEDDFFSEDIEDVLPDGFFPG